MPFKSKAQSRFMFATMPKRAEKWARHTKSVRALPDKKRESAWDALVEMPHLEVDAQIGGRRVRALDLKFERYPIPKRRRMELLNAFHKMGVVGRIDDPKTGRRDWHKFTPAGARVVSPEEAAAYPELPREWEKYVEAESVERPPRMSNVFVGKE